MRMSALGQKQTCAAHKPMSAFVPIADSQTKKVLRGAVGVTFRQCRIPMLGGPVRSLF